GRRREGWSGGGGFVPATSMSEKRQPRRGAFLGRRKGHALRARQARLLETLLPRLALDLAAPIPADLALLFPDPVDSVRLEIGFGGGGYMIAQAEQHPRAGFIGAEPVVTGIAKALAAIELQELSTMRSQFARACSLLI